MLSLQHHQRIVKAKTDQDNASPRIHFYATNPDHTSYEVYGEYAEDLCRALYRPLSSLRPHPLDPSITVLSISEQSFPSALKECLFVQSWTVVVVGVDGLVFREATPGNTIAVDDILGSDDLEISNCDAVVAAISLGKDGLVSISAVQGMNLAVCQYEDDPFLSTTETCLVQLAVKEIVMADGKSLESSRLRSIAHSLNCTITPVKPSCFNEQVGEEELVKMCHSGTLHQVQQWPNVCKTISALCGYMNLLSFDGAYHQYTLTVHLIDQFMRLDETALRSLDLFPKHGTVVNKTKNVDSLFSFLNKCKTGQGSRLLGQWLRQPLRDLTVINQRLDVQECLMGNPMLCKQVQSCLAGCSDLQRISKRVVGGRARLQDLLAMYQVIDRCKQLIQLLTEHADNGILESCFITPLSNIHSALLPFQSMIDSSVDLEAVNTRHEYLVKADFDSTLQAIADQKEHCSKEMSREHQHLAIKTGLERFKRLKLDRSPVYGHHFRVSRLDVNTLKPCQVIEYAVQKSGLLFTTVTLKDLSERYRQLEQEYSMRQSGIVKEMVKQTVTFMDLFDAVNVVLAVLDVSVSLAVSAGTAVKEYCRPRFTTDTINIVQGRHAVLEDLLGTSFVDNNYTVLPNQAKMHFITGPNMGGKSTYMRQNALIAIMAQMGCFVPARSAILPVFDGVLVRVGAGDNLAKGLSTFQAEMQEMASILRSATCNSLVLIDELGRGTSTSEGFGLAWSISLHMAKVNNPFCLFATHFHELAALAHQHGDLFGNLRVSALYASGEVRLGYRVEEGASEQSFGVHCAKLAKLPKEARIQASAHLAGLEGRLAGLSLEWIDDCYGRLRSVDEGGRMSLFEEMLEQVDESTRGVIMEILSS